MLKRSTRLCPNPLKVLKLWPQEIDRAVIFKTKEPQFVYYFPFSSWFRCSYVVELCFISNQVPFSLDTFNWLIAVNTNAWGMMEIWAFYMGTRIWGEEEISVANFGFYNQGCQLLNYLLPWRHHFYVDNTEWNTESTGMLKTFTTENLQL